MANKGEENLIPFNELTESERRKMGVIGGKASGEARRRKKTLKEQLDLLLSLPLKDTKKIKELQEAGIDTTELDNQMALVLTMYNKAKSGDIQAFNSIRDTIGEKPVDKAQVEASTDLSINISGEVKEWSK